MNPVNMEYIHTMDYISLALTYTALYIDHNMWNIWTDSIAGTINTNTLLRF